MNSSQQTEIAIIGAGIVGLAHALAAAKQGFQVTVFDRSPQAVGASIRNFGMVWPVGQPAGHLHDRAMRSRQIWQELSTAAGFALETCGSLHLAYRPDEVAVLEEFVATNDLNSHTSRLLTATEVSAKSPAAITEGLQAALWSATECTVDPREALRTIPAYLSQSYGVQFQLGQAVTQITYPQLRAGGKTWTADRMVICSGADFETLYPDLYASSSITKVKLQMMRTVPQPQSWRIGPSLCGGLTLTHYQSFAHCQALAALKTRIETETPHFPQWGIHVMMSQNASGELVLGDSHEYGLNPDPFDRSQINQWILDYLQCFAQVPSFQIAETWHGIYAKLPGQTEWIAKPEPGVVVVNALGGAGMTLSFGLAEMVIQQYL